MSYLFQETLFLLYSSNEVLEAFTVSAFIFEERRNCHFNLLQSESTTTCWNRYPEQVLLCVLGSVSVCRLIWETLLCFWAGETQLRGWQIFCVCYLGLWGYGFLPELSYVAVAGGNGHAGRGRGNSTAGNSPHRLSSFWFKNPSGALRSRRMWISPDVWTPPVIAFLLAPCLMQSAPAGMQPGAHSGGALVPWRQHSALRW